MSKIEDSIESSAYPLVFQADAASLNLLPLQSSGDVLQIRAMARPLAGMQKEAIIQAGPGGNIWRIVCDEGPWLNGTDLAPFPLAFFTAGLAASFMSAFMAEAMQRGVRVDSAKLEQDNFFSMEGSALRGTMTAGALPVEVSFTATGSATTAEFEQIAVAALQDRCPAERCLAGELASSFAVRSNNEELLWPGEPADKLAGLADPSSVFARLRPASSVDTAASEVIIRKVANPLKPDAGAVGLKADQKRMVHVHTGCGIREDGLKSIDVQCIQPSGSRFEFLSDDSRAVGGHERAPSGLAYLSAGVAFCFMTQIGRYAQISKQDLSGYRIIQDMGFRLAEDGEPDAFAVETLALLDTTEPPEQSLQLVKMSEQTCYIHASYQAPMKTAVSFFAA